MMRRTGYKTLTFLFVLATLPLAYHLWPKIQVIDPRSTVFLLLKYIPVLLLVSAGVLGLRLNQLKFLLVSFVLLAVYLLKIGVLLDSELIHPTDLALTASFTVPLAVCLLLLFDESRIFSKIGLMKVAVCFLPMALLLSLTKIPFLDLSSILGWTPFQRIPSVWISHLAVFPVLGLIAECVFIKDRVTHSLVVVFCFFLVPFYNSLLNLGSRPDLICVTYLCGAFMFLFLVIRQYWIHSYIDDLTEVPNRRALEEQLKLLPKRWCLAMIDIDHFKKFNDRYGHQAGDQVLRMVAAAIDRAPHGQVYRYGGEEFTILYKGYDIYEVGEYIDDLVDSICRRHFTIRRPERERRKTTPRDRGRKAIPPEKRVRITISAGVTERREDERNPHLVIERADKALYRAKKKGRNCAIVVE